MDQEHIDIKVKIHNNVKTSKHNIRRRVGYSSEDGQYKQYSCTAVQLPRVLQGANDSRGQDV